MTHVTNQRYKRTPETGTEEQLAVTFPLLFLKEGERDVQRYRARGSLRFLNPLTVFPQTLFLLTEPLDLSCQLPVGALRQDCCIRAAFPLLSRFSPTSFPLLLRLFPSSFPLLYSLLADSTQCLPNTGRSLLAGCRSALFSSGGRAHLSVSSGKRRTRPLRINPP